MKKIIISIILLSTMFSFSEAKTDYIPLSDINSLLGGDYTLGFQTTKGISNGDWMKFIYGISIVSVFVLAAVQGIKVGAILIAPDSSPESRKQGKEMLKKVALGIVFILAVWPLLYWIRPSMLSKEIIIPAVKQEPSNITPPDGNTPPDNSPNADDSVNRAKLTAAGIKTNHGNTGCTEKQMIDNGTGKIPPCTSLVDMPQETIDMLISLKNEPKCSSCEILITGGTEPGHVTHGLNKTAVDLNCPGDNKSGCDFSNPLFKFLYDNYRPGIYPSNIHCYLGTAYGPYKGFYFCNESGGDKHWHVDKLIH